MRITKTLIMAAAVLLIAAGSIQAQTNIPMAGIQTFDAAGDPDNTVINNVTGNSHINGVAWTAVDGATIGGSWGSEARAQVTNTAVSAGITFAFFTQNGTCTAGCGPVTGGFNSGTSTGTLLPFPLDPDLNLRVEFYESYVDVSGSPSCLFTAGNLTFAHSDVPVELMSFTIN